MSPERRAISTKSTTENKGETGCEAILETKPIQRQNETTVLPKDNASVAQDQGPRDTMEDTFKIVSPLALFQGVPISFYGVFDGHSGSQTAEFCTQMMPEKIRESLSDVAKDDDDVGEIIRKSLRSAFLETHSE